MMTLQDAIAQRDYWRGLLNQPQSRITQSAHIWLITRLQEAENRVTELTYTRKAAE